MKRGFSSYAVTVAVLAALAASLLAPAGASSRASFRTVQMPKTLSETVLGAPRLIRFRFPVTHVVLSWRGPDGSALEYRTSENSRWIAAGEDEQTPGARHTTGVLALARATALEWRGAPGPVRAVRVDYMNTLDGPVTTRAVPVSRAAPGREPLVVTRAEWGADESIKRTSGSCKRAFAPVQQLFVHHTAGSNGVQDSAATMRAIYHYHVVTNGWCDIGYNFVIGRDGRIYEGRWARKYATGETHSGEDELGRGVIGAHVTGYNTGSVGVSLMGNFELDELPRGMRDALVEFLAWKVERHGLDPTGKHIYTNGSTSRELYYIAGHRDAGSTACPGRHVYDILPEIRRETKERMRPRAPVDIALVPSARTVDYGDDVTLAGTLSDENGVPLAAREIDVYRRGAGAWRLKESTITGADGRFSVSARPRGETTYRADFGGDETFRGARSIPTDVAVRHVVTAFVEGGVNGPGAYVRFPPGTKSVVLYGWERPGDGSEVTVRLFRVDGDGSSRRIGSADANLSGGEWRYAAAIPSPGRFRAVARYDADGRHRTGTSAAVLLRVKRG